MPWEACDPTSWPSTCRGGLLCVAAERGPVAAFSETDTGLKLQAHQEVGPNAHVAAVDAETGHVYISRLPTWEVSRSCAASVTTPLIMTTRRPIPAERCVQRGAVRGWGAAYPVRRVQPVRYHVEQ
jgi:hypothetical protein